MTKSTVLLAPQATADRRIDILSLTPFDSQFGRHPKQTLPDPLHGFFQAQDQAAGQNIFALLDAARLPGGTEVIQRSGLPHMPLLQGKAVESLGNSSAWLVQVGKADDFTRLLFTRGSSPWHLWDSDAFVLIAAAGEIEDLRRHFRRFMQLKDGPSGRWHFFRFYSAAVLRGLLPSLAPDALADLLGPVTAIACPAPGDQIMVLQNPAAPGAPRGSRLTLADLTAVPLATPLRQQRHADFEQQASRYLQQEFAPAMRGLDEEQRMRFVRQGIRRATARGIRQRDEILKYLAVCVFWGSAFETDPQRQPGLWRAGWIKDDGTPDDFCRLGPVLTQINDESQAVAPDLQDVSRIVQELRLIYEMDHPHPDASLAAATLRQIWPARCDAMGDDAVLALAQAALDLADRIGLTGADALVYAALTPQFGLGFAHDPLYPWANQALLTPDMDAQERRLALGQGLIDYWQMLTQVS